MGGYVFIYDKKVTALGYSDIKQISVKDREVLMAISRYFDYKEPIDEPAPEQIPEDSISPWADFNQRNTVWELIQDDFTIVRRLKDKQVIKRHGATSEHSGYIYNNSGNLFLFTTGTIFPAEKILSPFAIYAWRFHQGDMRAASRDLYAKVMDPGM